MSEQTSHRIVPNEPTTEMIDAAWKAYAEHEWDVGRAKRGPERDSLPIAWKAMIAAAPDAAVPPASGPTSPIMNGDHAEFEKEWAGKDPKTRPDWPYPSFDARDWAEAFCKVAERLGLKDAEGKPVDEGWMIGWFANALMRGVDERAKEVRQLRAYLRAFVRATYAHPDDCHGMTPAQDAASAFRTNPTLTYHFTLNELEGPDPVITGGQVARAMELLGEVEPVLPPEPGQIAYEARWPTNREFGWHELTDESKADWSRVEAAVCGAGGSEASNG